MLALQLLGFAGVAQAAISILYPHSQVTWYKNDTVALNWTLTNPQTDTYLFRALLSNGDQGLYAGNHSIADSTNATALYVRVLLPGVPAGEGYIVNFVNTTNEAQVFATSQPFAIADGNVTSTTTSGAQSTGSATSSAGAIPNAGSSVAFPSASASKAGAAGQKASLGGMIGVIQAGAVIALAGAGMGLLV